MPTEITFLPRQNLPAAGWTVCRELTDVYRGSGSSRVLLGVIQVTHRHLPGGGPPQPVYQFVPAAAGAGPLREAPAEIDLWIALAGLPGDPPPAFRPGAPRSKG